MAVQAGPAVERVSPEDGPEAQVERQELQETVRSLLHRMSDELRMVIVLRDLQDLSYGEIAATLGVAVGTVKSRAHRARLKLRQLVQEAGLAGTSLPA